MTESVQGNQIISVVTETTENDDPYNGYATTIKTATKEMLQSVPNSLGLIPATAQSPPLPVTLEAEESNFKYMDKLQLPWSEKHWNLYVTNPKSSVEIWGRLIGPDYSVSHIENLLPSRDNRTFLFLG